MYTIMPRLQFPWLLPEPAPICFCGRTFKNQQSRGRHLRACETWKLFTPEQQKEHRDRIKYLSNLRSHNPARGRFKWVMMELRGELGK